MAMDGNVIPQRGMQAYNCDGFTSVSGVVDVTAAAAAAITVACHGWKRRRRRRTLLKQAAHFNMLHHCSKETD